MDQASFVAALIDKVSGPARKMKGQLAGLGKAFRDVNKAAKRDELGRFVGRSGSMLKKLEGSFKGAGKSLASAVETGVGKLRDGLVLGGVAVAGVAVGIGAATVKMADFAQTSRMGYQAVAKYGASAEKLFSHARSMAERFGMDVMQTSDSFKNFMLQGADPKVASQLVGMAGDMTAFGKKAEQVESVLYNVNKILAQGKAQGDELGPIFEVMSADKFYENLGQSIGKTKDELLKMKDAGQLTSDMIIPALIQTSTQQVGGKEAGDFAARAAESSMGGIVRVLKAKAQNAFTDIGTAATPAIMGALQPLADEFGQLFKSKGLQEGVIVAFETVGQVVRSAIPYVKEFVASLGEGFGEAWPAIKGALDELKGGFGKDMNWMLSIKEVGKSLGQVAALAVGVATAFGGILVAGIQVASAAVQIAGHMWEGFTSAIGATLFAIDDFFANLGAKWRAFDFGALATSLIDGLVNGIRGGIQRVVSAVGELGSATLASLKGVLGIKSPSAEFEYLGQMSGLGFTQGLEGSLVGNDNARVLPSFAGSVGSLMGAGAGGGGDVTVNVKIYIDGSGDPKDVANEVKESFLTKLGGALELMAAGAAA